MKNTKIDTGYAEFLTEAESGLNELVGQEQGEEMARVFRGKVEEAVDSIFDSLGPNYEKELLIIALKLAIPVIINDTGRSYHGLAANDQKNEKVIISQDMITDCIEFLLQCQIALCVRSKMIELGLNDECPGDEGDEVKIGDVVVYMPPAAVRHASEHPPAGQVIDIESDNDPRDKEE